MFTPRTRTHTRTLSATAEAVVEITSGKRRPSRYSVVLRALHDGEWQAVRCFDNAHEVHDEHRYTREGNKLPATKFCDGTTSDALDHVFAHLAENWQRMIDEWLR